MNDTRYALRPEAGPVPLDSLNRSQHKALAAIVTAVSQALIDARMPQPSTSASDPSAIDTHRASRLFFVSGQPGSGKSSIYATLRYVTAPSMERPDGQHKGIHHEYVKEFPTLSLLTGKTRWLEPIDLEVTGDHEDNLLAAVLVRIFDVIDRSSPTASAACRDAMEELCELGNDIGIAWDGNLKARGGSLDPDSYSQEALRSQQARLSTNSRLRSALDALFDNNCYGFSSEDLFVLPIDDFYLKPKASLELLRLLRMISVPRLFFLIMGDIKTVEALFFEKALADWVAVAGPEIFSTLRKRTKQEVMPKAREMKARYLRKLIPAGQRANIEWTEWDEALRSTPPPTPARSTATQPLCNLLSAVRIRWDDEPDELNRNLLNYLVSPLLDRITPCQTKDHLALPGPGNGKRNAVNKFREAYSGLQILDGTPREILDLWIQLQKFCQRAQTKGSTSDDDYLRMLIEYAIPTMEEQDFLTEKDQEILRFVFPTSTRDDLQLRTHMLHLRPKFSPWQLEDDGDVLVRRHLDWRLGVSRPKQPAKGRRADNSDRSSPMEHHYSDYDDGNHKWYLPPRLAAWIILLHDLTWKWERDSVLENLVRRLLWSVTDSTASIESPRDLKTTHPGWAWYRRMESGGSRNRWAHFPLSGIDTFRQLDRFLAIWSYGPAVGRGQTGSPPVNATAAAKKWAMAAWIVRNGSEGIYEKYVKLLDDNQSEDDSTEWYGTCVSSLTDGAEDAKQEFNNFVEGLFKGHPVLVNRARQG